MMQPVPLALKPRPDTTLAAVTVRPVVADELHAVRIAVSAWPEAPGWSESAWHACGASGDDTRRHIVLVAQAVGGATVGWVAGVAGNPVAELEYLIVAPAVRGRGVASVLLREWLNLAGISGASEVWLELRASNHQALQVYRRHGFAEQGRRRNYYREPVEDAVLMTLAQPAGGFAVSRASPSAI